MCEFEEPCQKEKGKKIIRSKSQLNKDYNYVYFGL